MTDRARPAARSESPAADALAPATGPPIPALNLQLVATRAQSLAHPIRVAVLRELQAHGTASPSILAGRLGHPLGVVSYHVRILRGWRLIEVSRTIPRRGAVEHYYRLSAAAAPVLRMIETLARGS